MRILHTVESYLPSRHGMQEVVTQLSEKLVKMGHEVTVVTSDNENRESDIINGVKIVSFNIKGNLALGIRGEKTLYEKFLKEGEFDIITNFAAQQWATDLMLPILNELKAKKVFVPTGFSGLLNPKFHEYFEKLQDWIMNYDANVFLSDDYRDINFAKKYNAKNILLIPNGADEYEFKDDLSQENIRQKLNISSNSFLVLTVGSHTGLKGHNESIEIFKKANLNNGTLVIVGNSHLVNIKALIKAISKTVFSIFSKKMKPDCSLNCFIKSKIYNYSVKRIFDKNKILTLSLKRKDTVALYKTADIFLFPSNIECSPIVLFESCAAKLPFLVTDVGNSKEIIDWTKGGELLVTYKDKAGFSYTDIEKSSIQLRDIYFDRDKRMRLAQYGYDSYLKRFTWQHIAKSYEELYKSLLNN